MQSLHAQPCLHTAILNLVSMVFGTAILKSIYILCSEIFEQQTHWGQASCPLQSGCPLLGGYALKYSQPYELRDNN